MSHFATLGWSGYSIAICTTCAIVDHDQKFQSHTTRQGLGFGNFSNQISTREHRRRGAQAVSMIYAEKWNYHSHSLVLQGVWTHWAHHMSHFGLSWHNLIYGPGPRIISFVLNATITSPSMPAMWKLWKYVDNDSCVLCSKSPCSLHHILANCRYALNGKR